MKKITLLFLLIPFFNFSQVDNEIIGPDKNEKTKKNFSKWDIGLNGGININNPISDSVGLNNLNSQGNLYGLTVVYHFNRLFAFKADFDIENRGWVMKDYELPSDFIPSGSSITDLKDVTQVLDYFDIPAFLHIGFGKKFIIDVNVGPYFGFKVKDEIYAYEPNGDEFSGDVRGAIGLREFDNFDFGLVYGIGFDYMIHERFSIGFDALYEKGMKVINDGGYKNSSLDFDFGINFHLGKKKKKK